VIEATQPDATSILAAKSDFEQRLTDDLLTDGHQIEISGRDLAAGIELDRAPAHDDRTRGATLFCDVEGA
jgi:hypothetical protein